MKRKLTYIALAGTLVLGAVSTASALEIQQNLRNQDTNTQTTTQQQRDAANAVRNRVSGTRTSGRRTATTVRTEAGETAPFVFGSTTTVDRPTRRQAAATNASSDRRALNVQIRTVQREYMNLRRANDPRAEQVRLDLERLKARQQQMNRSARSQSR